MTGFLCFLEMNAITLVIGASVMGMLWVSKIMNVGKNND